MSDLLKLPEGYGPPPPGGRRRRGPDLARGLRTLSGVDEDLLAWIWHERGRYTALGGVVLGTAVVAGFSMWNFANQALGRVSFLALLPAVVWALLVLNLDRWLIAPTPGAERRVAPLVTRLIVAVVLGVVVAEPLVLRIFESAVEEHVRDERTDTVDALRGDLLRCNPDPSEAGTDVPADCGPYVLSFGTTPGALATELASVREEAATLQERVDTDTAYLEDLDAEVRDECAQLIRNAVTGYLERTSECLRLRDVAADYRETHRTAENERRLAALNGRVEEIRGDLSTSQDAYLAARDAAVAERVAEERAQQREIGVLERMSALDELTGEDGVLMAGVWLVRLLFVFLDMLPVLVKFFAGQTSYDRLLAARSGGAIRIHEAAVRTTERQAIAEQEMRRERIEQDILLKRAELDAERREHVAAMNIRVSQAVHSLEQELRHASAR